MIVDVLLVLLVGGLGAFVVALAVRARRDFAAQNQVVPGVDSPAPASWAGAHSPEAVLHRRLRGAVVALRADDRLTALGLTAQRERIEGEALAIDRRLVAAAALPPPHRRPAVDRCEPLVAALEATVAELVTRIDATSDTTSSPELLERTVSDADLRLQALEQARAEVERIDRGPPDPTTR
jgi:hypothetical protein